MSFDKENIIHPDLERTDPTPNIVDLFRKFNRRFFWGKLDCVEVTWSGNRMTSCAGVCSFRPSSGHCVIRLSSQLLSLRSRKDLVETLLHEMIHAYQFITKTGDRGSDHGPQFQGHMRRINNEAGTNITICHSFNDEVQHYQQHIWRCNGPCQTRKPFFGFLKRAMNRAPGPNDRWWLEHKMNCNGQFIKIHEPVSNKRTKKSESKGKKDALGSSTNNAQKPITSYIFGSGSSGVKPKVSAAISSQMATPQKMSEPLPSTSRPNISTAEVQEQLRKVWRSKFPEKRKNTDEVIHSKKVIVECKLCNKLIDEKELSDHQLICSGVEFGTCPICNDSNVDYCNHKCDFNNAKDKKHVSGNSNENESTNDNPVCPICEIVVIGRDINNHIDECLTMQLLKESC